MDHNIPFNVISAGLKPILRNVLDQFLGEEESSHIDIIANDADINPTGTTWRPVSNILHPFHSLIFHPSPIPLTTYQIWRHTPSPLGHDKALTLSEYRTTISQTCVPGTTPLIIFIGDGVSDLPAAKQADLLFARRGLKLEWYCVQNKIAYFPFDTFGDILREVEGLMVSLEDQQVPRKEVEGRTVGLAEVRGGDFLEPSLNDTIPFPLPKLEESLRMPFSPIPFPLVLTSSSN